MATKTKSTKSTKAPKYVYTWGDNKADGDGSMKPLLGGKGANLAEMTRIGLPVPPGFTITTEVCTYFYEHKKTYPATMQAEMEKGVANMEKIMGYKFGVGWGMAVVATFAIGNAVVGLWLAWRLMREPAPHCTVAAGPPGSDSTG